MICFYHHSIAAVGICKSCGKGLCPECALDLGKGLACKGRCEQDVGALISLIDNNVKRSSLSEHILSGARSNRYLGAFFYLLFGSLFIGFAAYRYSVEKDTEAVFFFGAMGSFFMIFGVILFLKVRDFPKP
jgi:hypothetical protein